MLGWGGGDVMGWSELRSWAISLPLALLPSLLGPQLSAQLSTLRTFSSRVSHEDCIWQPGNWTSVPARLGLRSPPCLPLALPLPLSLCPSGPMTACSLGFGFKGLSVELRSWASLSLLASGPCQIPVLPALTPSPIRGSLHQPTRSAQVGVMVEVTKRVCV